MIFVNKTKKRMFPHPQAWAGALHDDRWQPPSPRLARQLVRRSAARPRPCRSPLPAAPPAGRAVLPFPAARPPRSLLAASRRAENPASRVRPATVPAGSRVARGQSDPCAAGGRRLLARAWRAAGPLASRCGDAQMALRGRGGPSGGGRSSAPGLV